MNTALYRFSRGTRIDAETLAVDLINELEFCEDRTYLDTAHTLSNFRDLMWDTLIFNRACRPSERYDIQEEDARLLDRAEKAWRNLVAGQSPVARPPEFVAELDRIVAAARRELLA
jgi:trimethylamine:corrinoid methyltransferase-like protein